MPSDPQELIEFKSTCVYTKEKDNKMYYLKKSPPHYASVIGDTVGDPLKDTSGPSLNILIKLSSVTCLVCVWGFL